MWENLPLTTFKIIEKLWNCQNYNISEVKINLWVIFNDECQMVQTTSRQCFEVVVSQIRPKVGPTSHNNQPQFQFNDFTACNKRRDKYLIPQAVLKSLRSDETKQNLIAHINMVSIYIVYIMHIVCNCFSRTQGVECFVCNDVWNSIFYN